MKGRALIGLGPLCNVTDFGIIEILSRSIGILYLQQAE